MESHDLTGGLAVDNRKIVEDAFTGWADGTGHVSSIFAEDMTWEIVGRSTVSKRYPNTDSFVTEVLEPFGRRFSLGSPFRPVQVRGLFVDGDTVIVVWDGVGTTIADTEYANTYAWIMRLRDGLVVDGIAFFDSIAFDELWNRVTPSTARQPTPVREQ